MSPKGDAGEKTVVSNRKARHDFDILEQVEAGMQLTGQEVKSLRGGHGSLTEAYARVRDGEVWLEGMHIPPYEQGDKRSTIRSGRASCCCTGARSSAWSASRRKRVWRWCRCASTSPHGLAKIELGLGRGRRAFEKRQSIAKREHEREIEQALGRRR